MNYQQAKVRAKILKSFAHPVRVLIIETLSKGDRCVGELNKLAKIDQSNISRHLAILKKSGVLSDRRCGMNVFYHLKAPCILKALKCAVEVIRTERNNKTKLLIRH